MNLSFNSKMEAYYQQFFELQERLRKSEEERLKLEMKFNELVQISREEEQAHYKKLRCQYKKFLEEDRKRQERNEKIIRTLERIESRVNTLTSKTERVKTLRRQYQSYLQRISQRPAAKQVHSIPKVTVEAPSNERMFNFDYDKKSSDIAMLKKAYGKTNDEKIEILDKYLQNLKSQKDQPLAESKPSERKADFNDMKYFDEVSKKFNEGFNSNKANSIAEDIMNSIYARHYKTDLYEDQAKEVSKFTSPRYESSYSGQDKNSGFGNSINNSDARNNSSLDFHDNGSKTMNPKLTHYDSNGFNKESSVSKYLRPFDEKREKENKKYGEMLNNRVDLSPELNFKENLKTLGLGKAETDVNENEKQTKYNNGIEANLVNVLNQDYNVENNVNAKYSKNVPEFAKDNTNLGTNIVRNINELSDTSYKVEQPESCDTRPKTRTDVTESDGMVDSGNPTNNNDFHNIQENEIDEYNPEYETKSEDDKLNFDQCDKQITSEDIEQLQAQYENKDEIFDEQQYEQLDQYDSSEQPIEQLYGESGKALLQYDENGQAVFDQEYTDDVPSNQLVYEETEAIPRYNNNEVLGQSSQEHDEEDQPIQMHRESNELVQQYNDNNEREQPLIENEQAGQNYEEVSPPVQQYEENDSPFDENGQVSQQSDEKVQQIDHYNQNEQDVEKPEGIDQSVELSNSNGQPIQQQDENGQSNQQYDDSGQPIQQFDEIGELVQQYDSNGQLIQQYDENVQPTQPYDKDGYSTELYDENGQPIQQYDEHGQPVQPCDENGQPIQQYDENGQPIPSYDENGQPIPQYDENGHPIYYNQGDGIVQYDENGQIIQQYDENGQPIAPLYDESYQHYDANGQPVVGYDGQLPNEFENGQSLEQYEANQYTVAKEEQNMQNDAGENIENTNPENNNVEQHSKKKNVLDLLDTDSESIKQNTSKISNDSDFDFSNG